MKKEILARRKISDEEDGMIKTVPVRVAGENWVGRVEVCSDEEECEEEK